MTDITINTEYIKLDQLLKWVGVAPTGAAAKHMIVSGNVKVNGETETRRGRKIRKGDCVEVDGQSFHVC